MAAAMRQLGVVQAGGSHMHFKERARRMGLDTSHHRGQGWSRGKTFTPKRTAQEILVLHVPPRKREAAHVLRRALTSIGREPLCEGCGLGPQWGDKPLVLEVDHIDGNCLNNTAGNLRYLCPNCHSQCETNRPWKYKPA